MKILLQAQENEFSDRLLDLLRGELPKDELASWPTDAVPPADAEMLIALGPVTAEDIAKLPKLKLLQTASDGYDSVDLDAATAAGVWVSYAPANLTGNGQSVAEFAVLLLLATGRRLQQALRYVRQGAGMRPLLNMGLCGSTVCIVGYGEIGRDVAKRLQGFEANVIAVDHNATPRDGDTLTIYKTAAEGLPLADFVVLCVRGSSENTHMVDSTFLSHMKSTAVLINIARGSLVDERALLAAIQAGEIAGAGLDVTEQEPPPLDGPLLAEPRVFVTPHVAGFTQNTVRGTAAYVAQVAGCLREGKRWKSLLNEPASPRVPLV